MTGKDFEKEIAELYQQRKAQTVAPNIDLQQRPSSSKYSPTRLLSLFLVGGIASFGVMAIISHLSNPSNEQVIVKVIDHSIDLIELTPKQQNDEQVLPAKPLPPKPESKLPTTQQILQASTVKNEDQEPANLVTIDSLVSVVSLPQLSEPQIVIEPSHKVLPKYSLSARQAKQTGEIVLSYQIDSTGGIKNIAIVSSNVTKELQRSAKKALAKWKYTPNAQLNGDHQVVFKFSLASNE